jgi:hypothetical protein
VSREVFKEMHFKVNKQDEWLTPDYAVKPLIPFLTPGSDILCPFDTVQSAYVRVFRNAGFRVSYSHKDRGHKKDFFSYTNERLRNAGYVISNPPYSCKNAVLRKLFSSGARFAMLFGGVGLFEAERFEMFMNYDFELMYFDKRIGFYPGAGQAASGSPPFSSIYVCRGVLPEQIVFARLDKKERG